MTRKFLHKTLVRNLDNLAARGGKAGRMLFLTGFSAIARGAGRVLQGLRGSGIAAGGCRLGYCRGCRLVFLPVRVSEETSDGGNGCARGAGSGEGVRWGEAMGRKKPVKNNRSPTFFINFASPSLGVSAGGGDVNTKSK